MNPKLDIFIAATALALSLLLIGCVQSDQENADATNAATSDAERTRLGKTDNFGSCVDACDGQSNGACWCDASCVEFGDCCADYADLCVDDPQPGPCEATGGVLAANGECVCEPGQHFNAALGGCLRDEQLCEATGGVFEAGECGCAQDGASVDHVFAADLGCVNAPGLCEDTGGLWEDDDCACAQDGASVGFEFLPAQGGCAWPAPDAIEAVFDAEGLGGALPRGMVHPEIGLYFVHAPGASEVFEHHTSLDTIIAAHPFARALLENNFCAVQHDTVEFDCDSFGQEGCFLEDIDFFDQITHRMTIANDAGVANYSGDELGRAEVLQSHVRAHVTVTDAFLSLSFGRIDGRWYLLLIDTAMFECGA